MGFFDSIKQTLGVGGVSFSLSAPAIDQNAHTVGGTLTITSKSPQLINQIDAEVVKLVSTGTGAEMKTQRLEMGKTQLLQQPLQINANETKQLPFSIPYAPVTGTAEGLKQEGGALGALGAVGGMMTHEKVQTKLMISGSVKGTAIGPSAEQDLAI